MAYENKSHKRQKVRYNSDNDDNALVYQLSLNGVKQTPASATIAIYKPGSTTAILAATAMTVDGTLLKYTVDSSSSTSDFALGEGYRGEIVVTAGGVTYDRVIMFDIVKFLLDMSLVRDTLINRDDILKSAQWNDDENFEGLLTATRDELSIELESKAFVDGMLTEDMILSHDSFSAVARLYALEIFWRGKDDEKADYFQEKFDRLWDKFLNSIKYDRQQAGEETEKPEKLTRTITRLNP